MCNKAICYIFGKREGRLCRESFTKMAFVDVGVKGEVITISKEFGDFPNRYPQLQQFLDPFEIGIKLTSLDDPFRLA